MEKDNLDHRRPGFHRVQFYYHQAHPEDRIVNLDKITYSANPENFRDLDKVITDDVYGIKNFAAESQVDRCMREDNRGRSVL